MPFDQIIYNIMREDKGDIDIYRFYVRQLRDCPEASVSPQAYEDCKRQIKELLEIDL